MLLSEANQGREHVPKGPKPPPEVRTRLRVTPVDPILGVIAAITGIAGLVVALISLHQSRAALKETRLTPVREQQHETLQLLRIWCEETRDLAERIEQAITIDEAINNHQLRAELLVRESELSRMDFIDHELNQHQYNFQIIVTDEGGEGLAQELARHQDTTTRIQALPHPRATLEIAPLLEERAHTRDEIRQFLENLGEAIDGLDHRARKLQLTGLGDLSKGQTA